MEQAILFLYALLAAKYDSSGHSQKAEERVLPWRCVKRNATLLFSDRDLGKTRLENQDTSGANVKSFLLENSYWFYSVIFVWKWHDVFVLVGYRVKLKGNTCQGTDNNIYWFFLLSTIFHSRGGTFQISGFNHRKLVQLGRLINETLLYLVIN